MLMKHVTHSDDARVRMCNERRLVSVTRSVTDRHRHRHRQRHTACARSSERASAAAAAAARVPIASRGKGNVDDARDAQ
jgi:hypothetical protein